MLWIVRDDDDEVQLFKNKIVPTFDIDGDLEQFNDVDGHKACTEYDFCYDVFNSVTGISLPINKPKKLKIEAITPGNGNGK